MQIKIWFQNRRTKWKRKYTSDVETLASQYYAQIGIGGIARPMVVGDRLWLFSQSPNVPHPSFGPAPQSVPPPKNPTLPMQSNRMPMFPNRLAQCQNTFLSTETPPNYDFNKSETFYRQLLSSQSAPNKFNNTVEGYFPPNQPKSLFNKLLWSNAFMNKPMERPYERFPFEVFGNGYNETDSHPDTMPAKEGCGIAELERVFGPNAEQRTNHPLNNESKFTSKLTTVQENNECSSDENSDVDCEQL